MDDIIKRFLSERLHVDFGTEVDDQSDLFQLGLLDSYTYLQLIRFVEETFAVRFGDEELLSNVTTSVSGLVALVTEKRAGVSSS